MKEYLLEVDETYKVDGTRTFYKFENEQEAIDAYHSHWRGMLNICVIFKDDSGNERKKLLEDENGRKYIKGSPFYNFPHVPHRSKIDGKEILST